MGQPKLLMPWGDSTLIEAQLAAWRASPVHATVVVIHPDDGQLDQVCRDSGAIVVRPKSPPEEMKVSVMHALRHLAERFAPDDHDAWLLAPADMPLLTASLIEQVLSAYDPGESAIIVPEVSGRRGHPVLFPWRLAAEVHNLGPDEGINTLRSRHTTRTVHVVDEGALCDVDTPTDYARLRNRIRPGGQTAGDSPAV